MCRSSHTGAGQPVELQACARRSGGDGVVVLRIKVDYLAPLDEVRGELCRSAHAVLLVGGGDDLECRMRDVVILEHRKSHGEADAVVGSQRRAACVHPVAVDDRLDGVVERVVHSHAHHVHVVQQHDGFGILMAWRCRLADHHAVLCVTVVVKVQPLGKLAQIVGHALLVV